MTSDLDKDIVTIKYNVLNLPEIIQFKNGNQMLNLYDAGGRKLRTKYYTLYSPVLMPVGAARTDYSSSNSSLRIDDYMGNILYEGGSDVVFSHPLTKILTPEGYIDYTDRHYCYFKKDHLGSIREVGKHIDADRVVVQKTQYYPSGTPYWEGFKSGEQPFKFTGKEMITMHGLNWQDYGARWLDNVKMQWTSRDPLCEMKPWQSPYMYCSGNPVNRTDPTGLYDLPEVTVTAPAPKKENKNFDWGFEDLFNNSNRDIPQIPKITPPTPVYNLPTNINNKINSDKNEKKENSTLESLGAAINATGVSADNVYIFTKRYAGKEVIYVTLSGTMAAANTEKVLKALKGIAGATIVLGIAVDAIKAVDNPSYLPKAIANNTIAIVAAVVGNVPGFILTAGYYMAIGDNPENLPVVNQPICPIDNTKVIIPNIKKR